MPNGIDYTTCGEKNVVVTLKGRVNCSKNKVENLPLHVVDDEGQSYTKPLSELGY